VSSCIVLAPSDLYLFHKLKEFMKGHKFSDDEDVICSGIRALEKLWTKYISVVGDYVEQ